LKPPRHDRFPSPNIFEAVPLQATASEKVTLVTMGIQSHDDYVEGFATLRPALYPLFINLLLRNLKLALDNIVDAQKEIRFRGIE